MKSLLLVLLATFAPAHVAPLAPVVIAVSLDNREKSPVVLDFPSPEMFFIEIRDAHGHAVFDTRTGHKPIPVTRSITFPRGVTRLASFTWDTLGDERRALEVPGTYVVHVEMQTTTSTLVADAPLTIEPPATIASVLAAPSPAPQTIAGTPERHGPVMFLRDDSGEVALSRPLGMLPRGRFIVRGLLERNNDGTRFVIERFAPAAGNLDPQGTPTPRASATPK